MDDLFSEIEPYDSGVLPVSPDHQMYYEQSGNPEGVPILYLHGGPGSGISPKSRRFFDPKHYRIILFDQRGCGKSTPHACLVDNTTWDLIKDMELLRKHLGIRKFILFGGSWGSTLALAYAISHPNQTLGLILRGIFFCRQQDIHWIYQYGASQIFPEQWDQFATFIPPEEQHDLVQAYYKRLNSDDEKIVTEAALSWSKYEVSIARLIPDEDHLETFADPQLAVAFAKIESHYFVNGGFFESPNFLLENVASIRNLPCLIIHGRYDTVCTVRNAWELKSYWPEAQLKVISDAGHAASEPGIQESLVSATNMFKQLKYDFY